MGSAASTALSQRRCHIPAVAITCYTVYKPHYETKYINLRFHNVTSIHTWLDQLCIFMPTTSRKKSTSYKLTHIRCILFLYCIYTSTTINSAHLCRKIKEKVNERPINFGPATLYSDLCVGYGNFVVTLWLMEQILKP